MYGFRGGLDDVADPICLFQHLQVDQQGAQPITHLKRGGMHATEQPLCELVACGLFPPQLLSDEPASWFALALHI